MLTLAALVCFGTVAILFIAPKLAQRRRTLKLMKDIPGFRGLPLIGDFHRLLCHPMFNSGELTYVFMHAFTGMVLTFTEGIAQFWLTIRPFVVVYKAETVQGLLGSAWQLTKSAEYQRIEPWLGTGLLTSSGDKWRTRRKMLTPTFHLKILEDFSSIFNEQAKVFVTKLKEKTSAQWVDIQPLAKRCSLDIICESAMGTKLHAQECGSADYVQAVIDMSELVIERSLKPWLWPNIIYAWTRTGQKHNKILNILHDFTRKVVMERKEAMLRRHQTTDANHVANGTSKLKRRRAFLDLLLTIQLEDNTLTDEDVCEEVDTFMFEGHDTTAAGISWALYLIGLNPDVQSRIHQEMDDIFGGDPDRPVTGDDLKRMQYLECALKESQRLFPSVPIILRELEDDIQIKEYTVPKGVTVMVFISILHRDPEFFPKPEVFDPDRFLPENSANRHPFAYVPFSAGSRNCIGQRFAMMEEKIVVAHVLRNFKVTSLDQRDKLEITYDLITKERKGLRLQFTERNRIS